MHMVTADYARETDTGVEGAMDVDVTIVLASGPTMSGEVTMVRDRDSNSRLGWRSYGDGADHWVSGDLLGALRAHYADHVEDLRRALAEIECAAAEAINADVRS